MDAARAHFNQFVTREVLF